MKAKPRRVDWVDPDDLRAFLLSEMGMSTKKIMEETGLTNCQVGYRLKKANSKRSDYRNGTSEMAKRVLERMTPADATIRGMVKAKIENT